MKNRELKIFLEFLILCRGCQYYQQFHNGEWFCRKFTNEFAGQILHPKENDFCSWGVRKHKG